jgi:hypothetical protein
MNRFHQWFVNSIWAIRELWWLASDAIRSWWFGECTYCGAPGPHKEVKGWQKEVCRQCGKTFSTKMF